MSLQKIKFPAENAIIARDKRLYETARSLCIGLQRHCDQQTLATCTVQKNNLCACLTAWPRCFSCCSTLAQWPRPVALQALYQYRARALVSDAAPSNNRSTKHVAGAYWLNVGCFNDGGPSSPFGAAYLLPFQSGTAVSSAQQCIQIGERFVRVFVLLSELSDAAIAAGIADPVISIQSAGLCSYGSATASPYWQHGAASGGCAVNGGQHLQQVYVATPCPAGSYATLSFATNCTRMRRVLAELCAHGFIAGCPGGTYAPFSGNSACAACQAGFYSPPAATTCAACAVGTYSFGGSGASACSSCLTSPPPAAATGCRKFSAFAVVTLVSCSATCWLVSL